MFGAMTFCEQESKEKRSVVVPFDGEEHSVPWMAEDLSILWMRMHGRKCMMSIIISLSTSIG